MAAERCERMAAGDTSFDAGWTLRRVGANHTDHTREAMTNRLRRRRASARSIIGIAGWMALAG